MNSSIPLGVCLVQNLRQNAARPSNYPQYILEILDHAGVSYQPIAPETLADSLAGLRVLITVGESTPDENLRQKLSRWLKNGGCWLAIGGTAAMPGELGVRHLAPPKFGSLALTPYRLLGEGYLQPADAAEDLTGPLPRPLHFFNGIVVEPAGAKVLAHCLDLHQRGVTYPAICQHAAGKGTAILIAVDIPGTIVHIQQGRAITRDGVSAPDGTAPVADGVLKADDGMVLDWVFDRGEILPSPLQGEGGVAGRTPAMPGEGRSAGPANTAASSEGLPAFVDPIADIWRGVILRTLLHLCARADVTLPMLWLYPSNAPAMGLLSHDSDGNEEARAESMLRVLAELKINSTWCIILPGYKPETLRKAQAAGHELATHFDAMEEGQVWSRENFRRQVAELTELFGGRAISNKNHYLRWEGDEEFWRWCVKEGIQLDQSKGPSKIGCAGFNFGTCHPYFPCCREGKMIDVLELPTHTQDLPITGPPEVGDALLAGTMAVHGVMHILFHQAHIDKPGVADVLRGLVRKSQKQGMVWRTAAQINAWERSRRAVKWIGCERNGEKLTIRFTSAAAMPGATVLVPGNAKSAAVNGRPASLAATERYGQPMTAVTFDIPANREMTLELK